MSGLDSPNSCPNPTLSPLKLLWVCFPIQFPVLGFFYGFTTGLYSVGHPVNQAHISLGKFSLFKKIEF